MYDWNKESTIRLIEHYQVHPILWDPRHTDFKDESKKRDAWTEISMLMKSERTEVERKMRSLIFQYNQEKKKTVDKKYGDITEPQPQRKWYAMNNMSFLSDILKTAAASTKAEQDSKSIQLKDTKCQNARRRISSRPQSIGKESSALKRPETSAGTKALQQKKQIIRDEYQIYGEHIACKIRKLPTQYSQLTVEHHINKIIHQAELGLYNHPPVATNTFVTSSEEKPSSSTTKIITTAPLMTTDDYNPGVFENIVSTPMGIV